MCFPWFKKKIIYPSTILLHLKNLFWSCFRLNMYTGLNKHCPLIFFSVKTFKRLFQKKTIKLFYYRLLYKKKYLCKYNVD